MNDNPYASPIDTEKGVYDHQLFWRLVKVFWLFAGFFLSLDVVALTKYARVANPNRPIVMVVCDFFTDWKSGSAPSWTEELSTHERN